MPHGNTTLGAVAGVQFVFHPRRQHGKWAARPDQPRFLKIKQHQAGAINLSPLGRPDFPAVRSALFRNECTVKEGQPSCPGFYRRGGGSDFMTPPGDIQIGEHQMVISPILQVRRVGKPDIITILRAVSAAEPGVPAVPNFPLIFSGKQQRCGYPAKSGRFFPNGAGHGFWQCTEKFLPPASCPPADRSSRSEYIRRRSS